MTTTSAVTFDSRDDGSEEFPLLILESPPDAVAAMLDDIREELGQDVLAFLREAKVLGKVLAVLLECKCAGHTPNLLEAIALANVERQTCSVIRANHAMELSAVDLDAIVAHAAPSMLEENQRAVVAETHPSGKSRLKAC